MKDLHRDHILPEPDLPEATHLLAEGRWLAQSLMVGSCPFGQDMVDSLLELARRQGA